MRAGLLKRRIDIQQNTPTRDSFGAVVDTWADLYKSVPATIQPIRGKEMNLGGGRASSATHKITIRYISGLDTSARIVWESQSFDIESVIDVYEDRRMIEIQAIIRTN